MLPFKLNLSFLLLKFLFLPNEFFSFSVKLLPLSFSIADRFVIETNFLHFLLYHIANSRRLSRAIFLKPSADYVKELLHMFLFDYAIFYIVT
jgi:hypothetical protein